MVARMSAWTPELQKDYQNFKRNLTRAINSKNPLRVLTECNKFDAYFGRSDGPPYPDDWSRWQRAREDANYQIAREKGDWLRS